MRKQYIPGRVFPLPGGQGTRLQVCNASLQAYSDLIFVSRSLGLHQLSDTLAFFWSCWLFYIIMLIKLPNLLYTDYYALLWNAKWLYDTHDPETYWGYVQTMGSTEGIFHAMWSARNYLSGKYMQSRRGKATIAAQDEYHLLLSTSNANNAIPVVFYSKTAITA